MVLKMCNPTLMHRTVPDGVDISAEYMFDENLLEDSPMSAFFRGKTVFITGGTGFIGQLFVERLLRSGVKMVYLLCRPKRGQSSRNRIQEMLEGPVFAKLSAIDPLYANKVKIITGDLGFRNLGISREDEFDLCHKIEIVIHAAVHFQEIDPLPSSVICNVRGTRDLLVLCERMTALSLFVHMSSAYAHVAQDLVCERFYEAPLKPDLLIRMVEQLQSPADRENLWILTQKIINPSSNVHMFTKQMAEELIREFSSRIPLTVIRPSIVIPTSEDPMPGWTAKSKGINSILTGIGFGSIRTFRNNSSVDFDLICADYVTNSTLAIICDVCKSKSTSNLIPKPKIFHITNGDRNPIKTNVLLASLASVCHDVPIMRNVWYPFVLVTRFNSAYKMIACFLHILPAIVIDTYHHRWSLNTKSERLQYFRKQHSMVEDLSLYNCKQLRVVNENCFTVLNRMTDYDKGLFPNDISSMNWRQYLYEFALGARLYTLKEPFETIQAAKRKHAFLRNLHYGTLSLLFVSGMLVIQNLYINNH